MNATESATERDAADPARVLWRSVEPVHSVVYFAPEVAEAVAAEGVVGWWTGYVAGRSAPLGVCPAELVEALFHGFAPTRVSKAVPAVWDVVTPTRLTEVRRAAVETALRRIAAGPCGDRARVARIVELLRHALTGAEIAGRGLYAAHLAASEPSEPVLQLWHACTLLREHRGDGHVAALTAAGLDGLSANVLAVAAGVVPDPALQRRNRGWSVEQWDQRTAELSTRGLLGPDGALTGAGLELRRHVEDVTDRAASGPVRALGPAGLDELVDLLAPWVDAVVGSGTLEYPNAMGVTPR